MIFSIFSVQTPAAIDTTSFSGANSSLMFSKTSGTQLGFVAIKIMSDDFTNSLLSLKTFMPSLSDADLAISLFISEPITLYS